MMERGGNTGPHKDGWGIAFYEGKGVRDFRDPAPSFDSEIARLVKNYPIKSTAVICHIRQANAGRVCLENTHPFTRELWGRYWTYAHNGQLKGVKSLELGPGAPLPVGTTDSEYAYCWMLKEIQQAFPEKPKRPQALWKFIKERSDELRELGVYNMLLTDGQHMLVYCSTKLSWITRRAPFGNASLKDTDVKIDFSKETTDKDVVTVVATEPLTTDEVWEYMEPESMVVFKAGELVASYS